MTDSFLQRARNGLWYQNPGLVQLLGLCPLLAVTTTFVNGLGLGVATLAVLTASNALVSATRHFLLREIRIPMYVLIIASLVTCTELVFKAWFPALDRSLGIFIPLIVTNCAIVARAEVYASRHALWPSIVDGFVMGAGFALLLMAIGLFRELLSLAWLMAVLPPGAFFSLALAVAARNAIDGRSSAPRRNATGRQGRTINR